MSFWYPGLTIAHAEKQCILEAMKHFQGNQTRCAAALGISVRTLAYKLEEYREDERKDNERRELAKLQARDDVARARNGFQGMQPSKLQEVKGVHDAHARMSVESAAQIPQEQQMPVSERPQVQEVLPEQVIAGRPRRGRPKLQKTNGDAESNI